MVQQLPLSLDEAARHDDQTPPPTLSWSAHSSIMNAAATIS